jgi:ATP-dependent Clp protease protease subunit
LNILSQNTGKSVDQLNQDMTRSFHLSAEQAKDYGLIDQVLQSPPK